MGSSLLVLTQATCTSSSPLPLWPLLLLLALQPTEPLHLMLLSSFPLSLMPMSMEWLMTTLRPTSRRLRPRMQMVLSRAPTPSPSLTAVSRPPPTLLTMSMVLLLRSPIRAHLSTPLSQQQDMAMPPLHTSLLEGDKKGNLGTLKAKITEALVL